MRHRNQRHSLRAGETLLDPISIEMFKAEVSFWAERLEVDPSEIRLIGMKRKWASCSGRGRVTFDIELLNQPEDFRREVIIHELLHLRVPNHGQLFSALLSTHIASAAGIRGNR